MSSIFTVRPLAAPASRTPLVTPRANSVKTSPLHHPSRSSCTHPNHPRDATSSVPSIQRHIPPLGNVQSPIPRESPAQGLRPCVSSDATYTDSPGRDCLCTTTRNTHVPIYIRVPWQTGLLIVQPDRVSGVVVVEDVINALETTLMDVEGTHDAWKPYKAQGQTMSDKQRGERHVCGSGGLVTLLNNRYHLQWEVRDGGGVWEVYASSMGRC